VVVPVDSPTQAEFREADEPAPKRTRGGGKITAETGAELIAGGFSFMSMTRPVYLREAWDFSIADCKEAGAKLANILNRLPTKYVNAIGKYSDPLMLALIVNGMYGEGKRREMVLTERYRAFLETQQSTGNAGSVKPDQTGANRNGNGAGPGHGGSGDVGNAPRSPDIPFQEP